MPSLESTKKRIRSIKSTLKITKAVELVASSKIAEAGRRVEIGKIYSDDIQNLVSKILAGLGERGDSYTTVNESSEKSLYIVISSTLGLCGGYNNNIVKEVNRVASSQDDLIVIGGRAVNLLKKDFNLIEIHEDVESFDFLEIEKLTSNIMNKYNEYRSIGIIYTKVINPIDFRVDVQTIIPLNVEKTKKSEMLIFELDGKILLEQSLPIYISSVINSRYLESRLAEISSRRNAMENATDNAVALIDKLQLEYNRVRQGKITQEITEIVSGAETL